jgi:SP family arabinose:H+ symporter-like MFS transporter
LNHSRLSSGITYSCLTAAIGGLLFGFDTAVISGTIGFVKAQFALDASQEGLVCEQRFCWAVLPV